MVNKTEQELGVSKEISETTVSFVRPHRNYAKLKKIARNFSRNKNPEP